MSNHKFEDIAVRNHATGLRSAAEVFGDFSLEQLGKLDEITEILEALPAVTVDDELDSVLESLREMRDRDA
tara:strand:- start:1064 stop:1276 length:213 start_codon:yes stop_codon:yes gene_type:complete